MTSFTRTLIALTAILGASAAIAADRVQLKDQLMDGSCLELSEDGITCLRLADQDQDQVQDRDKLQDGSCLDGDGTGTGDQVQTRTRTGEDNGKGEVARTRK